MSHDPLKDHVTANSGYNKFDSDRLASATIVIKSIVVAATYLTNENHPQKLYPQMATFAGALIPMNLWVDTQIAGSAHRRDSQSPAQPCTGVREILSGPPKIS